MSLLNSDESVEALVGFRKEQADLQYKELERLDTEISATMVSLRVHYESPAARSFNTQDAINSLTTFMQRAKEVESAEQSKKFNSIMLAPKAALWMKLPSQVVLPEDAIKPRNANTANQNQVNQDQERNKGFQQAGRNAWGAYQRKRSQELQRSRPKRSMSDGRSRPNERSRMCMGSRMFEPT